MFMIDTTGSMGDELAYLQVELADVIADIRDNIGQSFKIRLSINFYRDADDEYVVREFPFTEDPSSPIRDPWPPGNAAPCRIFGMTPLVPDPDWAPMRPQVVWKPVLSWMVSVRAARERLPSISSLIRLRFP